MAMATAMDMANRQKTAPGQIYLMNFIYVIHFLHWNRLTTLITNINNRSN